MFRLKETVLKLRVQGFVTRGCRLCLSLLSSTCILLTNVRVYHQRNLYVYIDCIITGFLVA